MEKLSKEQRELRAQVKVHNINHSYTRSMSLRCAVELGIADAIHSHGEPMSATQLATTLQIPPTKACHVARLMRLLVHAGFFAGDEAGYALTDASRHFLGVSPSVVKLIDRDLAESWLHLSSWLRGNGEEASAFAAAHGVDFWEHLRAPELARRFSVHMDRESCLVAKALMGTPEFREVFEGVVSLVDVGGNSGTMAKAVAAEFPAMECVVYDLPHVVAGLEGNKNLKFAGGDMFEAIPPAEAVLLKWILHDWSDMESVKILEQCKKAITSTSQGHGQKGKVIIIDTVIQEDKTSDDHELLESQLFCDMGMMVLVDGKERNEKEWSKLFSDAGFSSYKIMPGLGLKSIIEVYP